MPGACDCRKQNNRRGEIQPSEHLLCRCHRPLPRQQQQQQLAARQSPADRPRNNPLRGREGVFAGGKEPRAAEGRIYTETIAKINKAARVGGLPCYTRRETVGVLAVYSRLGRSTDRLTHALRIRRCFKFREQLPEIRQILEMSWNMIGPPEFFSKANGTTTKASECKF